MNCTDVMDLIDAYLDGELDPVVNQDIERHLRDCSGCDRAYQEHQALIGAIGAGSLYEKAPPGLRERVQSSLRKEFPLSARSVAPKNQSSSGIKPSMLPAVLFEAAWGWLALAAAVVLAALLVWNLTNGSRGPGAEQFLATQLVASHVRSLMASHLTDVASSDQHTVKPWFDGKLDFAPAVVDLASDGFPLVGGRLDYLESRPVAALVYQRRKHFINLFVWPVETAAAESGKAMTRQGYQLLHWADSQASYWAVSDVNGGELETFKQLIQKQTAPR
jgi:mycothiol system anti-sigma-R factor